jgi:hypothetical protein
MSTGEQWSTVEELAAARERFAARIPGWRVPAMWGVGLATRTPGGTHGASGPEAVGSAAENPGAETFFPVANAGTGPLPAVVLALTCGHPGGTAVYELPTGTLDAAIAAVSPALACTDVPHPNVAAWRGIRDEVAARGGGAYAVAVFVADPADPVADEHDAALRRAIAAA